MSYLIAADGGGTKTEAALFDERGRLYAKRRAGGSNPNFMELNEALCNIKVPVDDMLTKRWVSLSAVEKIVLFIPGMKRHEQEIKKQLAFEKIEIYGDETAALYGAFGGEPGIAVLSGTGSFAVGKNRAKETASVGGWGTLLGDEGSGYDIGIRCLKAAAEQYDRGSEDSLLAESVKEHFALADIRQIRSLQKDAARFSRERIAGLCVSVEKAALARDTDALRILDEAAFALAKLARTCAQRLGMDKEANPCTLTGGVAKMGGLITEPFQIHLSRLCPELQYNRPQYEPIIGAILFTLEKSGVPISEALSKDIARQYMNT